MNASNIHSLSTNHVRDHVSSEPNGDGNDEIKHSERDQMLHIFQIENLYGALIALCHVCMSIVECVFFFEEMSI